MSRRAFSDITVLLGDLLDRLEARPGSSGHLAYVDDAGFASVLERDRFERALETVEQSGGIQIQRRRVDGEVIIAHVRLADPAALYQQLGRQPGRQRAVKALSGVRARTDLPKGGHDMLDEIEAAWSRGVRRFGVAPDDTPSLESGIDLAMAIVDRSRDPSARSIDFRSFSRQAGTDSKALERLSTTVAALLGRLHPEIVPKTALDADELLATFGLAKTPQPLLVSAPLKVAGQTLPDLAYYGFPPDEASRVHLSAPVNYVLTVENYVSFVRHVREINAGRSGLVIYTGGFPARAHLRQIVRLAKVADAPAFHWGDMDAGGVQIFRHLEEALAVEGVLLRPHLMEDSCLREQGVVSSSQRRLALGACPRSAIAPLWDLIAETGLGHEQESLPPAPPHTTVRL